MLEFARRVLRATPNGVYSTGEVQVAAAKLEQALIDNETDAFMNLLRGTDARNRIPSTAGKSIDEFATAVFDAKAARRYMGIHKNCISLLFQIVGTVAAMSKAKDDLLQDDPVFVPDCITLFGNIGTSLVDAAGIVKTFALEKVPVRPGRLMTALAEIDVDALKFAGCAFGVITAIAGIVTGILDIYEGYKDSKGPDYYRMVGGLLEIIGGGCAAFVAFSAIGGAASGGTVWIVEAIAVACMVIGGVISLHDVIAAATWPAAKRWSYQLVMSLRGHPEDKIPPEKLWAALEAKDASVRVAMDGIVKLIEQGFARPDSTDADSRHRLYVAGVPLPVIAELFADPNRSSGGSSSGAGGGGSTDPGVGGARPR
jgi:uncharacterized membrane protein YgcG